MQIRYAQVLAGLQQAQRFISANDVVLAELTSGGASNGLDTVVERLLELGEKQGAHSLGATGELSNERKIARELRRKHMYPIVRMSRARVPAAAQLSSVSLPPARSNGTVIVLQARAMMAAVEPYRQLLHENGLPADFIEKMGEVADRLEQAVVEKQRHQVARVGTTGNIDLEIDEARLQVGVVDSLVRAALEDNHSQLGEWVKIVRGIRASFRRVQRPGIEGDSTPAPVPAPTGPVLVQEVKAAA